MMKSNKIQQKLSTHLPSGMISSTEMSVMSESIIFPCSSRVNGRGSVTCSPRTVHCAMEPLPFSSQNPNLGLHLKVSNNYKYDNKWEKPDNLTNLIRK